MSRVKYVKRISYIVNFVSDVFDQKNMKGVGGLTCQCLYTINKNSMALPLEYKNILHRKIFRSSYSAMNYMRILLSSRLCRGELGNILSKTSNDTIVSVPVLHLYYFFHPSSHNINNVRPGNVGIYETINRSFREYGHYKFRNENDRSSYRDIHNTLISLGTFYNIIRQESVKHAIEVYKQLGKRHEITQNVLYGFILACGLTNTLGAVAPVFKVKSANIDFYKIAADSMLFFMLRNQLDIFLNLLDLFSKFMDENPNAIISRIFYIFDAEHDSYGVFRNRDFFEIMMFKIANMCPENRKYYEKIFFYFCVLNCDNLVAHEFLTKEYLRTISQYRDLAIVSMKSDVLLQTSQYVKLYYDKVKRKNTAVFKESLMRIFKQAVVQGNIPVYNFCVEKISMNYNDIRKCYRRFLREEIYRDVTLFNTWSSDMRRHKITNILIDYLYHELPLSAVTNTFLPGGHEIQPNKVIIEDQRYITELKKYLNSVHCANEKTAKLKMTLRMFDFIHTNRHVLVDNVEKYGFFVISIKKKLYELDETLGTMGVMKIYYELLFGS